MPERKNENESYSICQVSICKVFPFVMFAMCERVRRRDFLMVFFSTYIFPFHTFNSTQFDCSQSIEFIISFMLLNKFIRQFFTYFASLVHGRPSHHMYLRHIHKMSHVHGGGECVQPIKCTVYSTDMCNRKPIHQLICVLASTRALYWLAFWANDNGM